jgi:hypothetical protein
VNGQYQNVWDADTKIDKSTAVTSNNQAYVKLANGNQTMWNMENGPVASTICVRDGEGRLRIAAPVNSGDCANKGYVDNGFVAKVQYNTEDGAVRGYVYCVDSSNVQTSKVLAIQAMGDTVPLRNPNGNFYVNTPRIVYECANKGYVDDNSTAWYKHSFPATRVADNEKVYISFYSTSATPHIVISDYGEITLADNIPGVNHRVSFIEGQEGYPVLLAHASHIEFNYKMYTNLNSTTAIYIDFSSTTDPTYVVTKL